MDAIDCHPSSINLVNQSSMISFEICLFTLPNAGSVGKSRCKRNCQKSYAKLKFCNSLEGILKSRLLNGLLGVELSISKTVNSFLRLLNFKLLIFHL